MTKTTRLLLVTVPMLLLCVACAGSQWSILRARVNPQPLGGVDEVTPVTLVSTVAGARFDVRVEVVFRRNGNYAGQIFWYATHNGPGPSALVSAVNQAEALRGFESPLWVDTRISRSVRAAGFRDRAFERLLGSDYAWMPDLGNVCVQERRDCIEIRRPAAAEELLDHALRSPRRRVIFFCSCKLPGGCHRRTVAALVKRSAERRGIDVNVVEWPGGAPREIGLTVPAVVLRAVARGAATTIDVPAALGIGVAASLPWGSRAVLTAVGETLGVLVGPAGFSARGAQLKILSVNPGPSDVLAVRSEHEYEC